MSTGSFLRHPQSQPPAPSPEHTAQAGNGGPSPQKGQERLEGHVRRWTRPSLPLRAFSRPLLPLPWPQGPFLRAVPASPQFSCRLGRRFLRRVSLPGASRCCPGPRGAPSHGRGTAATPEPTGQTNPNRQKKHWKIAFILVISTWTKSVCCDGKKFKGSHRS